MNFFSNIRIKSKLAIVFLLMCIIIFVVGGQGLVSSNKINSGSKMIYEDYLISIKNLENIKANMNEIRANLLLVIYEKDNSKIEKYIKITNDLQSKNDASITEYEKAPMSDKETKVHTAFKENLIKYRETRVKIIDLAKNNNYDEALKVYIQEVTPIRIKMLEELDENIKINTENAKNQNELNQAAFNSVNYIVGIFTVFGVALAIILGFMLTKNIAYPLVLKDFNEMLTVADKYSDDAGFVDNLVSEFSSASEELLASIQDVLKTIEQVSKASNEGAEGATNIAQKVIYITEKSNEIVQKTKESKESADNLKIEISKFKVL